MIRDDDAISTNVSLTRYLLWTRENPSISQEIFFEDLDSVSNSNFDGQKPTKILAHGYTGNGKQSWVIKVRDNFLEKGTLPPKKRNPVHSIALCTDRIFKACISTQIL